MAIQIRTIGQFNPIHFSTVAGNWDPFDQKQEPIDGQTRHRNNANLSHAMRLAKKEPRVLILGSGRCKEFDLARVAERSEQVTLVDIRERPLANAAKSIDKKLRKKLDLVQADLSPFDSAQFFNQAEMIIRQTRSLTCAIEHLRNLVLQGITLDQDPLSWFNGKADLAMLINTISPITYDFLYWPTVEVINKWQEYHGGTLGIFPEQLIIDLEARMFACFMRSLKARLSDHAIAYAVVYRSANGQVSYPLDFYQARFSPHFTLLLDELAFKTIESRPAVGNENIAFLMRAGQKTC